MVMALDKMPALSDYGTIIAQFLPFVVLIVVFYFFLIRPQRKKDKEAKTMLDNWERYVGEFIQVVPIEYKRVLQEEQMQKLQQKIAEMQRDY